MILFEFEYNDDVAVAQMIITTRKKLVNFFTETAIR